MVIIHPTEKIKHVGLCEFAFHNEVLRSFILHFLPIVDNLSVFTSKIIYEQLYDLHDRTNIRWILFYNNEQVQSFIIDNNEKFNSCDLLVITSLPDRLNSFKPFLFSTRVWIVIHNNNTVFTNLLSNLFFRQRLAFLKDVIKFFKAIIQNKKGLYTHFLNNCENIILPSEAILSYNKSHIRQLRFKEPIVIPFAHFDGILENTTNYQYKKIVVPGTISDNVRDYKLLFDAFEKVLPNIIHKIELVLLGRLKDEYIVKSFEMLVKKHKDHFSFRYYKDFIDQKHFDQILLEADFLILPLKECVSHDGYKEYFGLTTESGSINDFVRFGKHAILPQFYPIHKGLEPLLKRYHDLETMAQCMMFLINNDKCDGSISDAKGGLSYYSSSQVSQRILDQWNRNCICES